MVVVEATAYMRFASALHGGRSKKATIPLMNELPVRPAGDRGRRRDGRPGLPPSNRAEKRARKHPTKLCFVLCPQKYFAIAIVIPETTTTSRDQTSEISSKIVAD
jgi:hypothetical protein